MNYDDHSCLTSARTSVKRSHNLCDVPLYIMDGLPVTWKGSTSPYFTETMATIVHLKVIYVLFCTVLSHHRNHSVLSLDGIDAGYKRRSWSMFKDCLPLDGYDDLYNNLQYECCQHGFLPLCQTIEFCCQYDCDIPTTLSPKVIKSDGKK